MKARLFTDGGARGNPGPAASAYVIEADDGTVLAAHGEAIGVATNNVAEYRALVAGPRARPRPRARAASRSSPTRSSSSSRCAASTRSRTRRCAELSLEAARLAREIGDVRYTAVRREHNELADRLVNEALDAAG